MFINTSKETTHNQIYSIFDTDTGIRYKLTLLDQAVATDNLVILSISSINGDDFISYSGNEALSFWEKMSFHPKVKPDTALEYWFTQVFNKADDLLTAQEKSQR